MSALLMGADLPANVPVPQSRPDAVVVPKAEATDDRPAVADPDDRDPVEQPTEAPDADVPPPLQEEDPVQLTACLAQLKQIGIVFTAPAAIDENNGCGIRHPLTVTALGAGVALQPAGTMRCETALALGRWTRDILQPMLKTARPDDPLAAVNQASTYVCRKRNNTDTGKISEHARGNAVDISGLTFKSKKVLSIEPRMQDSTLDGALQRAITSAACLYFTTVLDPGSDAAHERHLHLDIIARKNGYRLCW
jgi:hypothetical protein